MGFGLVFARRSEEELLNAEGAKERREGRGRERIVRAG